MKEALKKIFSVSYKIKILVFVALLASVVGGYLYAFYLPLRKEVATLNESLEKLFAEVSTRRELVSRLPEITEKVEQLDIRLRKALLELPDGKEIPQLLTRVSDKAKDSGLEIRFFRPMAEIKKEFYAEVPVQILVAGTYHQLATFFDEVGHLERIVNLSNYVLESPQITPEKISVRTNVIATAFRFLSEEERAQAAAAKTTAPKK